MTGARRVLVVGGAGEFGSRLVRGILEKTGFDVILAGRDLARAERMAGDLGREAGAGRVSAVRPDGSRCAAADLAATGAFAVADAAGPFQGASYSLAGAAVEAGMHYVDLADGRAFVAGFGPARRQLDPGAHERRVGRDDRGVGAGGLGPRRPVPGEPGAARSVRGAGRPRPGRPPVRTLLDGAWREASGWGRTRRVDIPGVGPRWASLCETPDLDILAARFPETRSVEFLAGLELPFLHWGVRAGSLPVRTGLAGSLAPCARRAKAASELVSGMGTDRGGMVVRARGLDAAGRCAEAEWSLAAKGGDGPFVPTLPALAVLKALARGEVPCVGTVTLDAIMECAAGRRISCAARTRLLPPPLFERVLGDAFAGLPEAVRLLHAPGCRAVRHGTAHVTGGTGLPGRLVARLVGFPVASGEVPVTVGMERADDGEVWTREFAGRRFRSVLKPADRPGRVTERFGPLAFDLDVSADARGTGFRVVRWRAGPFPMPRWLGPVSRATERADAGGGFLFDVEIRLPLGLGLVARYTGRLDPA